LKGKVETLKEHPSYSFCIKHKGNFKHVKDANLSFLRDMKIGFTLNICCGNDPTGDVKADIDRELLRKLKKSRLKDNCEYVCCDVKHPPFRDNSFDTVICDPPFSIYNRLMWIIGLANLTRKRLILSSPPLDIKLDKRRWERKLYYIKGNGIFLRLWWVFTKRKMVVDKG
jgi:hypothetical protein